MTIDFNKSSDVKIEKSQLNKYCLKEIENNLKNIEILLHDLNDNQSLIKMLDACQTIEDLAMVYGYDGVETLACNMSTKVASIVKKDQKIPSDFLDKFFIAIKAMRNMSGIDDDEKINNIVNKTIQKIKNKSKQSTQDQKIDDQQLTSSNDTTEHDFSVKMVKTPDKDELAFDIKETDSLMNLINMIENNNKRNEKIKFSANDNHSAIKQNRIKKQAKKIENDIFVQETIENLNFLQNSVELVKKGESLGEAIMRIKEACCSLKDSATSFNITAVQQSLTLLNQIVKEKLTFNRKPSLKILDVIAETEKVIRNFIEHNEAHFDSLNEKLNHVLKNNNLTVTDLNEHNITDEDDIKIVNDVQPENNPIKKKKTKVIFDEDTVRRRISKFK